MRYNMQQFNLHSTETSLVNTGRQNKRRAAHGLWRAAIMSKMTYKLCKLGQIDLVSGL